MTRSIAACPRVMRLGRSPTTRSFDATMAAPLVRGSEWEAAMTQAPASADSCPDPQISSTPGWPDGHAGAATAEQFEALLASAPTTSASPLRVRRPPLPVPELASDSVPEPHRRGGRLVGRREFEHRIALLRQTLAEQIIQRDRLRLELSDLNRQVPVLITNRDELQMELHDLHSEILASTDERDELIAAVGSLKANVADLRSKQQELSCLNSKLEVRQYPKPSTERLWSTWTRRLRFHDS